MYHFYFILPIYQQMYIRYVHVKLNIFMVVLRITMFSVMNLIL